MQYGGGGHRFMKLFHKIPLFFEGWLPLLFSASFSWCLVKNVSVCPYSNRWRAESSHRTRAPPHIKSYTREQVGMWLQV